MQIHRLLFGGLIVAIVVSIAAAQDRSPLRQKFDAWVNANLSAPAEIQPKLVGKADELLGSGSDICIYSDGENVRARQPLTIFTYSDELFTLPLTIPQARALGVYAGSIHMNSFTDPSQSKRLPRPVFELSDIRIDNPSKVDGKSTIIGHFTAKKLRDESYGRIVVRTGRRAGTRSSRGLKFYEALPADGVFGFGIDPLSGNENAPFFGLKVVMVDLLVTGLEDAGSVASNTLVMIVDIPADYETYARSSAQVFEQIITIFESVKDRQSAQDAVRDYTRVMVQAQALAKAIEHLPPLTPEQERQYDTPKYNAQAEALAQRLQAQMTRLEQADYAGPQFIDSLDAAAKAATAQP